MAGQLDIFGEVHEVRPAGRPMVQGLLFSSALGEGGTLAVETAGPMLAGPDPRPAFMISEPSELHRRLAAILLSPKGGK